MGRTWVWSAAEAHFTGAEQAWAASYTSGSLGFLIWEMRLTIPMLGVYRGQCHDNSSWKFWKVASWKSHWPPGEGMLERESGLLS